MRKQKKHQNTSKKVSNRGVILYAPERAILRRTQDSQSTTGSRTAQGREVVRLG